MQSSLSEADKHYVNILRGASVLRVVLAHLGLAWFFPPYSFYIGIFFPVLFFVSGVVSYNSYLRSEKKSGYLLKRCLGIAIPFFVFMLPIAVIYAPNMFELSFEFIMKWIVLRPDSELFPFPIGQIWFITCLLFCALFSFPLFYLQSYAKILLLMALFILVLVPAFVSYEEFALTEFYVPSFLSKYILFEVLALMQFFILGACYVLYRDRLNQHWLLITGLLTLAVWFAIDIYARQSGNIQFSELRPNTYVFQSFGVILVLLGLQKKLLALLNYLPKITGFILHCNRHAYSIFILHIPILYTLEYLLEWQDLSDSALLAFIRLILVVTISLILAVPFSWFHKKVTNSAKGILLR